MSVVIKPNFEWRISSSPVPYPEALAEMERRVDAVDKGEAPELFWLLEHPPTYTAGTSAARDELVAAGDIPVYDAGRGGRYTYHGPGQRVIYIVSDLRQRGRDVRAHVARLEEWIIRTIAAFGITGERRCGRIGIWVQRASSGSGGTHLAETKMDSRLRGNDAAVTEEKVAAIGVRVRRWVAFHGLALNVDPNLEHFKGIVPCGLAEFGVTSLRALGSAASMAEVDAKFRETLPGVFDASPNYQT